MISIHLSFYTVRDTPEAAPALSFPSLIDSPGKRPLACNLLVFGRGKKELKKQESATLPSHKLNLPIITIPLVINAVSECVEASRHQR
jgi:hypothetical protein